MNALKKITDRAKQIRKKSPGVSWKSAIKKAGVEYRSGKKAPVKKRVAAKRVRTRSAVRKRITKKRVGNVPMVAGVGTGNIISQLSNEQNQILRAKAMLWKLRQSVRGLTAQEKKVRASDKKYWQKAVLIHGRNLRNLKRLL